jgi:integrase
VGAETLDIFFVKHPRSILGRSRPLRSVSAARLLERPPTRNVKIDRLNPAEIGAWRKALPARSGYGIHKALRQVLHYAVRAKLLDENPAAAVPNPEPKRTEVQTFTLGELDLVADELSPTFRPVPVFAALTGLRPCEWVALERRDVDREAGVVTVRRTVVDGQMKPYARPTAH